MEEGARLVTTFRLTGPLQRELAKCDIDRAPEGHVVKIGAETRRDAQNRKMHAMIRDIQRDVPEMAVFNADDAKLRFLDALGVELRFLPKLEGQGLFPVGLKSSTLTVAQFNGLIDLLYEYGGRHGVVWSEPMAERR